MPTITTDVSQTVTHREGYGATQSEGGTTRQNDGKRITVSARGDQVGVQKEDIGAVVKFTIKDIQIC